MSVSAIIIRQWFHWVALSTTVALLTACGGSGGDDNQPPVAMDGSLSTIEDTPATGSLSANDPDDTSLTFSISLHASLGNVTITNPTTGEYTYTPNANTTGTDQFQFKASDGKASSSPATITVVITPNQPPVANDDNFTVDEGAAVSDNVIDNPSDPSGQDTDPENQPMSAALNTSPAYGSLVFNTDGSFTYTHDGSETSSDSFTYRVHDGKKYSAAATVNLTINPVNDAPVANDDTGATNADTSLAINVLSNDTDPDDSLSITAFDSTSALGATVTLDGGDIRYNPTTGTGAAAFIALADGETVLDTFSYTISGGTATATATVSVTVTGVNDPPLTTGGACSTTQQESILGGMLPGATDPDNGDMLTYSIISYGTKGYAQITDSTTGAYTYNTNSPFNNGEWGSDSFTYRVTDIAGDYVEAQETVIIDPRIMPLGDSITRGTFGSGLPEDKDKIGYRKPLYDGLVAAGYSFDFVGNVITDGNDPSYAPFDFDSEGHGGWWAIEIADGNTSTPEEALKGDIIDWLDATSPDIILLHIGTNGIDQITATENASDVGTILDKIEAWEIANGDPITVILARIIDQNPNDQIVTDFNNALDAMVAARTGDDIIVVDMENLLTAPADYYDALHPTNDGYAKMAPVWQSALTAQANGLLYNNKCP